MFRLIAIDFSQKSPHFSLLSPTSPCELSEREVTSPSNLKVVGALDNYSLVFVIFINFFGQLKDWVGQVLFLVSCPKGQVEKYVNVEACNCLRCSYLIKMKCRIFVMDLPPSKHLSCTLSQYLTHNFQHLSYGLPTHFLLSVALALNGNQFVLCVKEITQIIKC